MAYETWDLGHFGIFCQLGTQKIFVNAIHPNADLSCFFRQFSGPEALRLQDHGGDAAAARIIG